MQIGKDLYDSRYLYEKYKIKISQKYGNILEDLSVGVLKMQDEEALNYFGLKNLQEYLIGNSDLMDWRIMVLLQKPDIQQYFIARWLLRNIQEAVKNNEEEYLINLFLVYFSAIVIMFIDKEMNIVYNKFNYYVVNLGRLLLFEITDRYEFAEKTLFVIKNDRFKGNSHIFSKYFNGKDINPDIYRL